MQIRELMSQPIISCPLDGTLDQAARLMWEFDCGIVAVVNDEGRIAGVVTDRDICMAAYTQGRAIGAISVDTAMARQVIAVHQNDRIEHAEALMRDHQVRRLPVLDDEARPVGMVAMNDLARLAARVHRSVVDRELVRTMAAVCQPRSQAPVAPVAEPDTARAVVAV
jgi:CBS domain-containing protein